MQRFRGWMKTHSAGLCVTAGVLLAFLIVVLWCPSELWQLPVQTVDVPVHLNYIQRIVQEGISVIPNLKFEGGFYPPLFHTIAAAFAVIFSQSIPVAATVTWVLGAGILFPLGMVLFVNQLLKYREIKLNIPIEAISIFVPILSMGFAVFPYKLLEIGTLYAYGFAVSLIPFTLAGLLKLVQRATIKSVVLFLASLVVIALAQPRALFLVAIVVLPFLIIEMKKRGRRAIVAASAIFATLLFTVIFYTLTRLNSELLWHPENWYATLDVGLPLWQGVWEYISATSWQDPAGVFSGIIFTASLVTAFVFRKDIKLTPLLISWLVFGVIFVLAVAPTTGISNIVGAPWYKNPWRISPILPIILVPIIVTVINYCVKYKYGLFTCAVALICFAPNTQIPVVRENIMSIADTSNSMAMLSNQKIVAYSAIKDKIGDAFLLADPFTGVTLSYALNDIKLIIPIQNPRVGNSKDMVLALNAISTQQYTAVCDISSNVYLATMGQPYTTFDPLYHQYDNLHSLETDNLIKVDEFESGQDQPFILYRINCENAIIR